MTAFRMFEVRWPRDVPQTEFNLEFVQGMANRMAASFFKYGRHKDNAEAGVDFLASLHTRLAKYEEDGNTEWLMDVANLAMIEFMNPSHPDAHFRPTDSDESPGRTVRGKVNVMGGQGRAKTGVHTHVAELD